MNVENLKKLRNFIPSIPKDKLRMHFYVSDGVIEHTCGTSGCIIGHGVGMLTKDQFDTYLNDCAERWKEDECCDDTSIENIIKDKLTDSDFHEYWSGKHFELTDIQWQYLFGAFNPNSTDAAIERINNLIEWDGVIPKRIIKSISSSTGQTY